MMRRHQRQHGFTLMEAIVALVLIATTGMALFSWVNSNILTLQRVQAVNAQEAATVNALQYLHNVNPMATPEGKATLGAYTLNWTSEQLAEPRDTAGYPTGNGLYQIAIYQMRAQLKMLDGKDWFDFKVQQVGYKKVREIKPPL
jgi:general secretion pathway protein I